MSSLVNRASTPVSSAADSALAVPGTRLLSLDVFRGLTVAAMILVTDPGTYSARYAPLAHAEWMGATATDMIMPAFLFIVGVSITLSFAKRRAQGATRAQLAGHALRRWLVLMVLGLAVNGFPFYDWHTLRWPGILQRIGCSYLVGALLWLALLGRADPGRAHALGPANDLARFRGDAIVLSTIIVAVLAAYGWALLRWPVPGSGAGRLDPWGCLPGWVDRKVLGVNHMWIWGTRPTSYDPDGLLTLIPGACGTLYGVLAGSWMRTGVGPWRKVLGLLAAGAGLFWAGYLLRHAMPLNKRIWTSTFSLVSGGVALMLFAFFYAVVDLWHARGWTRPALVFGTNAVAAFACSSVITEELARVHVRSAGGRSISLGAWGYSHLFLPWLRPIDASLAYAGAVVLLNGLLLLPLYRRRLFLRI